jgi:short-subunit dehydrogenase
MFTPRTIVITGASSGIGAALAKAYAAPGITLGLLGRDRTRLKEVATACLNKGATAKTGVADVRDYAAMAQLLTEFDKAQPIDLLIANAGISASAGGLYESPEQVRDIFAVNLDGVLNTVSPVIPLMQSRKCGQIAIISSLASIRGLPSCPAYSASKAAVRYYGEGLRGVLGEHGIDVSVICPGYIRTPMTDANTFPMPFIMSADKAASIMKKGLTKGKGRIAFPLALYLPLWWLACLSPAITDPFFAALPRKTAMER